MTITLRFLAWMCLISFAGLAGLIAFGAISIAYFVTVVVIGLLGIALWAILTVIANTADDILAIRESLVGEVGGAESPHDEFEHYEPVVNEDDWRPQQETP